MAKSPIGNRRAAATGGGGPVVSETLGGFALETAPGHLLRLCQQRAVTLFADEIADQSPTPRQFAALLAIYENPGINQTDLVRKCGIDRSTLAEMLPRMIEAGYVHRERSETDQRTNALYAADAGVAALIKYLPAVARAQERILAPLSPADRTLLMTLLAKIADQ